MNIPTKQTAVQLVGPDELALNNDKPVDQPGPYGILAKIEAVGLCFSDLKLLKQFSEHARKSDVLEGIDAAVLPEIQSYCPNEKPVVPGHEAVATVVAVGDKVTKHQVGERVLIQTDYRWLKTANSNAAFGYNFEGGLQQYVLMDERVIVDPATDESFLIPVQGDNLSASAVALVEPWACVESSYITDERRTLKSGGQLLVVADLGREILGLNESCAATGKPAAVTMCCADPSQQMAVKGLGVTVSSVVDIASLPDEGFDDIIYFGSQKATLDVLNDKLAKGGIINIVLAGTPIGESVTVGVGRVHYGLTRWIGTSGVGAEESYYTIPENGEIRDHERIAVIGAAGPMGQMHVIRLLCAGKQDVTVVATDLDDARLEALGKKASPAAQRNAVPLQLVNTQTQPLADSFTYFAIMVPVAPLVSQAIALSTRGTLINVFAGIPAPVKHDLDLDTYINNRCFMFGTSGSRLIDMKIVLDKVTSGQLDTNCSVDAVSGMAGAIEGIRAVENRTLSGKIIVYPDLPEMGLVPLAELEKQRPTVGDNLEQGLWTKNAESALLAT
ncbi:alcohol dehydrogenase catalytic domain-containing protein [Planctomycetota bacterium]